MSRARILTAPILAALAFAAAFALPPAPADAAACKKAVVHVVVRHAPTPREQADAALVQPMVAHMVMVDSARFSAATVADGAATLTLDPVAGADLANVMTEVHKAIEAARPSLPDDSATVDASLVKIPEAVQAITCADGNTGAAQ